MSIFRRKKTVLGNKKPVLDKKQRSNVLKNSVRVVSGVIAGAAAGLLLAPQSGRKTREKIKEGASDLGDQIGEKSKEIGETTKEQFNTVKETVKEKASK